MKLTKQEVTRYIQDFLDGTGEDWDDFTSIPISNDPHLEQIRLQCAGLREEYHPENPHEYCAPEGEKYIRDILMEMRKKI